MHSLYNYLLLFSFSVIPFCAVQNLTQNNKTYSFNRTNVFALASSNQVCDGAGKIELRCTVFFSSLHQSRQLYTERFYYVLRQSSTFEIFKFLYCRDSIFCRFLILKNDTKQYSPDWSLQKSQ